MNEESYYKIMTKSLTDKEKVVSFIKKGDNVLDFGAGTGDISNSVLNLGANYFALDNSEQAFNYLKDKKLNVFKTIDEIVDANIKFDVIYFSSVLHEVFSYSPETRFLDKMIDTLQLLFVDVFSLLKEDGLFIIRDFPKVSTPDNIKLQIKEKHSDDFKKLFLPGFLKNKMISEFKENSLFDEENGLITIQGNSRYIFELLYHFNWGEQSFHRENKEFYGLFNRDDFELFEKSFNCKLLSYDEYFSEDYRHYLEDKFILSENNKEIEWFNNKYFAVLKKES